MRVVYSKERSRFEAITRYSERRLPKEAGFLWDGRLQRWHAQDPQAAAKLIAYADEPTGARIKEQIEQEAAKTAVSVAASRATDSDITVPAPAGREYRAYQRAGIAYALPRKDTLFGDEMGLGKTIQAIGIVNTELAKVDSLRVLVVAPKIALLNWKRELTDWLIRPLSIVRWTSSEQADADIVIINYDILARKIISDKLRALEWDIVIFDEAHALKNLKAQRTLAALGDSKSGVEAIRGRRRLFLTGTPLLNRPIELFPILNAVGVPAAKDFYGFARRYCNGHMTMHGFDASGASNLEDLENLLRSSVMVRRNKSDVLRELPHKSYELVEFDLDSRDAQAAVQAERLAGAHWDQHRAELEQKVRDAEHAGDKQAYREAVKKLSIGKQAAFTEMARLRHETALAKVPQAVDHIVAVLEATTSAVLVFCHHRDVIEKVEDGLVAAGYMTAVIIGNTDDEDRQQAQLDIQQGSKRVFVGSIRACGMAITLTAASTVIFVEQDWAPAYMAQAEDRAHRIGQSKPVLVQHLVLAGSFDATMAKTLVAKAGIIEKVLGDEIGEAGAVEEIAGAGDDNGFNDQGAPQGVHEGGASEDIVPMGTISRASSTVVGTPALAPHTKAPRRRGRPPQGDRPLTKSERNRRWRSNAGRVAIEVPQEVAADLRRLRSERGGSIGDILREALVAFKATFIDEL